LGCDLQPKEIGMYEYAARPEVSPHLFFKMEKRRITNKKPQTVEGSQRSLAPAANDSSPALLFLPVPSPLTRHRRPMTQ
jgi:hypothetical protein